MIFLKRITIRPYPILQKTLANSLLHKSFHNIMLHKSFHNRVSCSLANSNFPIAVMYIWYVNVSTSMYWVKDTSIENCFGVIHFKIILV